MADGILDPAFVPGTKEYHSRKSREWYARTKQNNPDHLKERDRYTASRRVTYKALYVEKFGGKCAHCGGAFPACAFDFHHLDASAKERAPAKLFALSPEKIEAELAKCIMLCANCHRIEHERLKVVANTKIQPLDAAGLARGRPRGVNPMRGVPKPGHSEAMKNYWRRKKATAAEAQ